MIVNELRVNGAFEFPYVSVDDEVDVTFRVRIYSIERDRIDVSTIGRSDELPGGLRVQAVAVSNVVAIPADYAESADAEPAPTWPDTSKR